MNGWVKIHRKLMDNPIVTKDADYLAVWIYLLLNATHEDYPAVFNGEKVVLRPGQLISGRKKIASELHVNESKVYRILNAFKSEHQIEQQACTKNSLFTILKWSEYQCSEQQDTQQLNNKRTADEQQPNNERTTTEQQLNTNKNKRSKEQKNERTEEQKKTSKRTQAAVTTFYPNDERLNKTFADYVQMRKQIKKPMTDKAIELAIKKLDKMAVNSMGITDNDVAIEILEQSILNSWQGLFPLKEDRSAKGNGKIDWSSV